MAEVDPEGFKRLAGQRVVPIGRGADGLPAEFPVGSGSALTDEELRASPVPVRLTTEPTIDIGKVDQGTPGGTPWPVTDTATDALVGPIAETVPASDTASSGLNGRLQRIAQRLTSLIALLPASLGQKTTATSLAVVLPSDGTLPLPTGAATSAKQDTLDTDLKARLAVLGQAVMAGSAPVTIASDQSALAVTGPLTSTQLTSAALATAAGQATTHTDLVNLLTTLVLAAGSNLIGKVGIDQTTPGTTDSVTVKTQGRASAVTLTRTADGNAYSANDVVGAATGSTAALTFPIAPSAGGEIMITSVTIQINDTALISGETSYDLHLYNVTPPSALADNAAFDVPSGDRASYLGKISLGTPVDLGSTLRLGTDAVNKQITAASGNVFAYLVTVGNYTPTASRVWVITLHTVAL